VRGLVKHAGSKPRKKRFPRKENQSCSCGSGYCVLDIWSERRVRIGYGQQPLLIKSSFSMVVMKCTTLSTLTTGPNGLLAASFSVGPNLLSCPTYDRSMANREAILVGLEWNCC
jgi:hypothetical protein